MGPVFSMIRNDYVGCANPTVVAGRYMDKEHSLINAVRRNREALGAAKTPGKNIKKHKICYIP